MLQQGFNGRRHRIDQRNLNRLRQQAQGIVDQYTGAAASEGEKQFKRRQIKVDGGAAQHPGIVLAAVDRISPAQQCIDVTVADRHTLRFTGRP
ncbi:hypothetical protein AC626_22270 [Pseudoalteromonas rubra]|uniref:Uncharacterized protein n=1 Tax=Pseudoalteromonas rubra TaxID=43658 RepID=A0A0L0EMA3_9GAMM|nr:hypothetical protein AC626_22270 [Pseudoalteromonas rubra]